MVRMKRHSLLFIFPFLLAGCFNDRGVSLRYYNNCEEYYDLQGYLHKRCDKNLVDYRDIYEAVKTPDKPTNGAVE